MSTSSSSERICNVLISSAGRRVALLRIWRDALSRLGLRGSLIATDMSACAAAVQDADRFELVPPCSSENFLPRLMEICERENVRVLVPTIDTELPMLAEARADFVARGTTINISAPETIAIAYDKHATHAWLTEHDLPTVEQARAGEIESGESALEFPLIVKPARGSSAVGVARVENLDQLRHACQGDFVAQSIARGVEYTVDVLINREGHCAAAIPRRRLEVRAGEVSKGLTVRNTAVERLAQRVAEALPGAYGVLNVQIFHDEISDVCSVIEINPRYGGGFPLTWQAGGLLPIWFLEEVLDMPSSCCDAWRDGLVMLRYDDAVFVTQAEAGL